MKAAGNGVVNASVLDGWWDEGWTGDNGWAIGDRSMNPDEGAQDWSDALDLYRAPRGGGRAALLRPDGRGLPGRLGGPHAPLDGHDDLAVLDDPDAPRVHRADVPAGGRRARRDGRAAARSSTRPAEAVPARSRQASSSRMSARWAGRASVKRRRPVGGLRVEARRVPARQVERHDPPPGRGRQLERDRLRGRAGVHDDERALPVRLAQQGQAAALGGEHADRAPAECRDAPFRAAIMAATNARRSRSPAAGSTGKARRQSGSLPPSMPISSP